MSHEAQLKPWVLLAAAQTPGDGAELCLYQRDQEFAIQADDGVFVVSPVKTEQFKRWFVDWAHSPQT